MPFTDIDNAKFQIQDLVIMENYNFLRTEPKCRRYCDDNLANKVSEQIGLIKSIDYRSDYGIIYGLRINGENWFFPESAIKELFYEGYTPPPLKPFAYCEYCGSGFFLDETLPEEDRYLCENCRKRQVVLPYHRHTPKLDFFCTEEEENEEDKLYFGIESEVDEGGEDNYTVRHILPLINTEEDRQMFIYCSHDGSLHNGFEIITQPATPNYHRQKRPEYEAVFNYLKRREYVAHNTSTCGIHIHFNRDFFKDNEELYISKLLYIIEKHWEDIIIFSRRSKNRLRYCKKRDGNLKEFISAWDKSGDHEGHYYAVNLTNQNTIEFRIFKGTLNINTFFCIIDYMENLVRSVKTKSLAELRKMKFEDFLSEEGKEYFNSRKEIAKFSE